MMADLHRAFEKRLQSVSLKRSNAYRLFHGPGEGAGAFRSIAIDRFGDYAWCTFWQKGEALAPDTLVTEAVAEALKKIGIVGSVWLSRPEKGTPELPIVGFGTVPEARFEVFEGQSRFWVQLKD